MAELMSLGKIDWHYHSIVLISPAEALHGYGYAASSLETNLPDKYREVAQALEDGKHRYGLDGPILSLVLHQGNDMYLTTP